MCLTKVDAKPACKFGVGYKSVQKRLDGTYTCYDRVSYAGTVDYPINQWVADPNDGQADGHFGKAGYRTGFHISLDKEDMLNLPNPMCTIKVRFRKVTATQCNEPGGLYGRQVVAREIMNLGEV